MGAEYSQRLNGQYTVTGGDFSAAERHEIYEVTFDLQGGNEWGFSCGSQYRANAPATKPDPEPYISRTEFYGWSTAASGGETYPFTEPVAHDVTLYAQWEKRDVDSCSGSAIGFSYDGTSHRVKVNLRDTVSGYQLVDDVDYTLSGDVEKTDAGTYTVTATGKRNYFGTTTVRWTIGRARQSFTAENMSLTVGSSAEIAVSHTYEGTLSYEVRDGRDIVTVDEDGKVSALKVGTATVRVYASGGSNYDGAHVDITVNVSMGDLSINWPNSLEGFVYVDDENEPTPKGGSATYKEGNVPGTFSISGAAHSPTSGQKQGTVTFTPEDSATYGVATSTMTVTVRPYTVAQITTAIPDITDKPVGTGIEDLGLPARVQIKASARDGRADRYYNVPVIWRTDTSGYKSASAEEQAIRGLLDLSEISAKVIQPGKDVYAWANVTLDATQDKQQQTLAADDVYLAYGETGASVALASGSAAHGDLRYAVESGDDVISVNASTGAITAKKAGAATVTITAAGDEQYEQGSVTVNVVVSKATPEVSQRPTVSPVYVNDADAPSISGGTANVPGSFHLNSATRWDEAGDKPAQLIFIPDDDDNYGTIMTDATVNVQKRSVESVTTAIAPITDKYYDTALADLGLPAAVSIQTADGKAFDNVPVAWSGYESATTDEQTLTGTLDLAGISGEVENTAGVAAQASVTLQKLTIDEGHHTFSNKTAQYTGRPITHQIDQLHEGVASVAYSYQGTGGTAYGPASEGPTNVGAYTVTAAFTMKDGYEAYGPLTSTLTIIKADQRLAAPDVRGSFGDTDLKVTATGASTPLTYAVVDGADVISVDAATGAITTLKPGTAKVRVSAAESDTHNGAQTDTTVTIHTMYLGLATVTTVPTAKDLTYNRADQTLVEPGVAEGGTMAYSLDGRSWSDELPTGNAAGTYEVFYKALGDENHDDSPAASITVTIKGGTADHDPKPEPATYTVTYTDGVDGEEAFADQVTDGLLEGDATPQFAGDAPTRDGYTFAGWSPEPSQKVTGNVVYVATWKKDGNSNADGDADDTNGAGDTNLTGDTDRTSNPTGTDGSTDNTAPGGKTGSPAPGDGAAKPAARTVLQTGDNANPALAVALVAAGAAAVGLAALAKRRRASAE